MSPKISHVMWQDTMERPQITNLAMVQFLSYDSIRMRRPLDYTVLNVGILLCEIRRFTEFLKFITCGKGVRHSYRTKFFWEMRKTLRTPNSQRPSTKVLAFFRPHPNFVDDTTYVIHWRLVEWYYALPAPPPTTPTLSVLPWRWPR